MRSAALADVLDVPKQGIPPENLSSLRIFLAAQRKANPPSIKLPKTCLSLPDDIQTALLRFLVRASRARYERTDGKPKREWYYYHGDTWEQAWTAVQRMLPQETRSDINDSSANTRASVNRIVLNASTRCGRVRQSVSASNAARAVVERALEGKVSSVYVPPAVKETASLMARLIAVRDQGFELKDKCMAFVRAEWEVWEKGYGLAYHVGDIIYAYGADSER